MYLQVREAMELGTVDCPADKAAQLAACNLQVAHGSYQSDKHSSGFLLTKLDSVLPKR